MVEQVQILFQALGLTLLHFCWQGAIIALVAKLVSMALPRLRPRLQYAVSLCAMLAMAAAAVATFAWEQARLGRGEQALGEDAAALGTAVMPQGLDPMSLLPWIDALWALGVLFLALRTVSGLRAIHRLKANAQPVPEALAARFAHAARLLGLTNVHIRMHPGIDSPFVVGIFRSVVYLPVSAVTTLSPDQIDAVLAHELEHIRRADFAWNLLQTVLETLFFYHPAVWWLGRTLREQRELACDDAAVRTCSDPLTYATALLRLEEQRRNTPHLAVALNGDGSGPTLLTRVRRILGDTPKGANPMSPRKVSRPALLAAPVVLVTLAALAIPAAQVVAGTDGTLARICNIKSIESITGSSGLSSSLAFSDSSEDAGPESPAAEAGAGDVEPKDFWSDLMPGPQKNDGDTGHRSAWTWVADIEPHIDHEELARAQVEGLAEAAADMRREAEQFRQSDPTRAKEMQAAADRLAEEARVAGENAAVHARHAEVMQEHADAMALHAERMERKAAKAIDVAAIQERAEREARKAEAMARKADAVARKIEAKFRKVEFNGGWEEIPTPPEPPEPPAAPAAPEMSVPPPPPAPPAPPALKAPPAPPKPMAVAVSSVIVRTKVVALPNGKIVTHVETESPDPAPSARAAPNAEAKLVVSIERKVRIS